MVTKELDSRTRDRIVEAAGAVFAEKGFESATVREICSRAHANLAAINYYFGDKQRLYVEAIRRAQAWRADRAPFPHWGADVPAEERLHDFILVLLTRMLDEQGASWHAQLMLREISRPDTGCQEQVFEYIRPQAAMLEGIIAELMPEALPNQQRLVAFSIIGQCLYYRVAGKVARMLTPPDEFRQFDPPRLARHIADLTLAGIGRRPPLVTNGGEA